MAQWVKNPPAMQETQETPETWVQVQSLGWENPRRRKWQPTPLFLPGKFHGQSSLVGYSPWGRKESDTTERPHFLALCKPKHVMQMSEFFFNQVPHILSFI